MSEGGHSLQYIEKGSFLHRIDPITKIGWLAVVVVGMFTFKSPVPGLIMLCLVTFLALVLGRVPLKVFFKSSFTILWLGLLLGGFHSFVHRGPVLFTLGPLTATTNGVIIGAGFFFRMSVVVLSSFLIIWTTSIRDLMVGLVKLGLPYRFAFAVFMALRFLPIIQREVDAVQAAHTIRGRAAKSQLSHRFKLWQRYMFTILINGLRKAESMAMAIECRGFGAYPDRTYVKDIQFKISGVLLALVFLGIVIALKWAEGPGALLPFTL